MVTFVQAKPLEIMNLSEACCNLDLDWSVHVCEH